jgi:hypothetical protein
VINWNYRVFREESGDYVIREVFYNADGAIFGCTETAVEPLGSSLEGLAQDIEWFKEALTLPILTLADVPSRINPRRSIDKTKNFSTEQVRLEFGLGTPTVQQVDTPRYAIAAGPKDKT